MNAVNKFIKTKRKFCKYYQKTAVKKKLYFSRSALFHMNTRVCLKYFLNGSRYALIEALESPKY